MKSTADDIKDNIKEKINSPIFGAFIVTSLILNWKFFLIIFSELKIDKKIEELDKYYTITNAVIYPLLIAIFISFLIVFIQYLINLVKDYLEQERQLKSLEYKNNLKYRDLILNESYEKRIEKLKERRRL